MKKYTRSQRIEVVRGLIAEGRVDEAEEMCRRSKIAGSVFRRLCRDGQDDDEGITVTMPLATWRRYEEYRRLCARERTDSPGLEI